MVAGTGWELSTREPTLLIGVGALVGSAAAGLAALAGSEASVKENTVAITKAHLITRITLPFPQIGADAFVRSAARPRVQRV